MHYVCVVCVCVCVCEAALMGHYQFWPVTYGPGRHHGICLGDSGRGQKQFWQNVNLKNKDVKVWARRVEVSPWKLSTLFCQRESYGFSPGWAWNGWVIGMGRVFAILWELNEALYRSQWAKSSHFISHATKWGSYSSTSTEGFPFHGWAEGSVNGTVQSPVSPLCFREG